MIKISAVMPTYNRREFIPRAISCFLKYQCPPDWELELIIVDNGTDPIFDLLPDDPRIKYSRISEKKTHGALMNECFQRASGEVCIVWDDDDWYAPDRVSKQVQPMINDPDILVTGTEKLYYYVHGKQEAYLYSNKTSKKWIGLIAVRRSAWEVRRFADMPHGADYDFLQRVPLGQWMDLGDPTIGVLAIHPTNASYKHLPSPSFVPVPWEIVHGIMENGDKGCYTSNLSSVTILITTFLRDGYLFKCLDGIKKNLPECEVVVVDDGKITAEKEKLSSQTVYKTLPFDSGLSAKRNAGVTACKTKYLLMGCDDFDFSTPDAREGIKRLVEVLDGSPALDVASGRVNGRPYEGFLEYQSGKYIRQRWLKERPIVFSGYGVLCDITVNYFLMRVDSLREVLWDDRMKIGGEHGDWFLSLKLADKKIGWVPGVNITTLDLGEGLDVQDPRYCSYRDRAHGLGHRIFKEKWGIADFIGFNGESI